MYGHINVLFRLLESKREILTSENRLTQDIENLLRYIVLHLVAPFVTVTFWIFEYRQLFWKSQSQDKDLHFLKNARNDFVMLTMLTALMDQLKILKNNYKCKLK